jgi:hypothetical protein
MDLDAEPFHLEIELLAKSFDKSLADVAEGSDVIGEDANRYAHGDPLPGGCGDRACCYDTTFASPALSFSFAGLKKKIAAQGDPGPKKNGPPGDRSAFHRRGKRTGRSWLFSDRRISRGESLLLRDALKRRCRTLQQGKHIDGKDEFRLLFLPHLSVKIALLAVMVLLGEGSLLLTPAQRAADDPARPSRVLPSVDPLQPRLDSGRADA